MKESATFRMEENGFKLFARWDGCIDFWRLYGPGSDDMQDYIHLCCGVDELVQLLLKAKAEAKHRGSDEWDDNNAEKRL